MQTAPIDASLSGVLWAETSKEPAVARTRPAVASQYDVAVVGGGFCGLSIALHAALQGLSVILFEAGSIGNGASGRNGGFVVPHFPGTLRPSEVRELLGRRRADRLCALVSGGPSFVFDQIRQFQIACDAEQKGWVQPAHSKKSLPKVRAVFEEWKALGAEVEWLDRGDVGAALGTSGHHGGWVSPSGGTVNPFALCQGLARVAINHGAHILQDARVTEIRRLDGVASLRCADMDVKARKVVIATNGYTDALHPGLQRSVIPLRLFHTFTKPLTEDQQAAVLPTRLCFTDVRKSGGFCRYDSKGRILSGGAVFAIGDKKANGIRHSRERLGMFFPQAADLEFEYYWEGYCAVTPTYLPSVQVLDTDIYAVLGFSTRGVSLAQILGREFAGFLGETLSPDDLPLHVGPVAPIPWQPAKAEMAKFAFPAFKVADRLGFT